jgi:hypothetical protein
MKLDDKHKLIKSKTEECYNVIKQAKKDLKKYREECKHPKTSKKNYSWRIGSSIPSTICDVCGEVIKTPFDQLTAQKIEWEQFNDPNDIDSI